MTDTLNLTMLSPVEVDTKLSELWAEEQKNRSWLESTERSLAAASSSPGSLIRGVLNSADRYRDKIASLRLDALPFEDEFFRRGGWKRYFLVTNDNGHVHRGTNCSTCFPSTQYGWLIDLADCDESAMVAEWGEKACTVCFPDAPTFKGFSDGTSAYARRIEAEKAQRAAEKAERVAKKAAKTLDPEHVFHDVNDRRVVTVAGAKTVLREAAEDGFLAGTSFDSNGYYRMRADDGVAVTKKAISALTAKGVTEVEINTIIERAEKKARKEYRQITSNLPSWVKARKEYGL